MDVGRTLNRPEFRVLLAQMLERLVDLALLEGLGRVRDGEPRVLAKRDGGLDLHHRLELERRALLERHFFEIGLLDRLELGLLERLAVNVGDQVAGDFLFDVIGEVQPDHARWHLALAEAGQPGLSLDALEGFGPRVLDDLRTLFHLQAALARADLLDGNFHSGSRVERLVREGGVEPPRV